jgi:ABC-type glutathione transport system ATPase component
MSIASNRPPLLALTGARVEILDHLTGERRPVLENFDLTLLAGKAIGITGLSGSGKSTLALALAGLLGPSTQVHARQWEWLGENVISPSKDPQLVRHDRVRRRVSRNLMLIQQDARSSLVPYKTVSWHLTQAGAPNDAAALSLLKELRLRDASAALHSLPAKISTGECQRVQLGMARLRLPTLLVADEPFSSLDDSLRHDFVAAMQKYLAAGNGLILISHVLDVLRSLAEEVVVLCNGQVAERGPAQAVLNQATAQHPHTRLLLELERSGRYELHPVTNQHLDAKCLFHTACHLADPARCVNVLPEEQRTEARHTWRCSLPRESRSPMRPVELPIEAHATTIRRETNAPLLRVKDVQFHFGRHKLEATWNFDLTDRDRLGLLAPSGAGKSTLARAILGLVQPQRGTIERFSQHPSSLAGTLEGRKKRVLWRRIQLVHQDTDLVFDPTSLVGEALAQAWRANRPALSLPEAWQYSHRLMAALHLPDRLLHAPPQLLSGGERRRAAIAYRLAAFGYLLPGPPPSEPRVLIVDEPTVGLDEFMQAKLAAVLLDAWRTLDLTYLVISHDWRFVERFCTGSCLPSTAPAKRAPKIAAAV